MPKRGLAHCAGLAPISHSGLARIVTFLRENPQNATSRRAIARDIDEALDVTTPYGHVLQSLALPCLRGADVHRTGCHPGAMPTVLSHSSVAFESLLRRMLVTHRNSPRTPWHLVMCVPMKPMSATF